MAVIRIHKTHDYTVMSNHHLKNKDLSLKSKGLLSMILSLPDGWNYTTRGLASICKEGVDSIGTALKELENTGYIQRNLLRDKKGKITDTEYVIFETPQAKPEQGQPDMAAPNTALPHTDYPHTENPYMDMPCTENPVQLNTNISITNKSNKDLSITDVSNPILSNPKKIGGETENSGKNKTQRLDRIGTETINTYRQIIKTNIEYDIMCQRYPQIKIDEIIDLLTETVCSSKEILTIAGDDYPAALVKSKLLKLDSQHIEYVLDCIDKNTSDVRNIKKYMLAALFNAPSTIDSYYTTQVNHDMRGGGYD